MPIESWSRCQRIRRNIPNAMKRMLYRDDYRDLFSIQKRYPDIYFRHSVYSANDMYGHSRILKQYANYKKQIMGCIEHGLYFGRKTFEGETTNSGLPGIITFSEYRREAIRDVSQRAPICVLGPYIRYASPLLEEDETSAVKRILGKTLLVLPSHSTKYIDMQYNYEKMIANIKSYAELHGCKTIIVCLFYQDIVNGKIKLYKNHGFKVVSAGHHMSPHYLNRLRSYIELSDLTMSNSLGTHIGYCIALSRPHYVCQMNTKPVGSAANIAKIAPAYGTELFMKEESEICELFSSRSGQITEEQLACCDYYWGNSVFRSREEMKGMFSYLSRRYEDEKEGGLPAGGNAPAGLVREMLK